MTIQSDRGIGPGVSKNGALAIVLNCAHTTIQRNVLKVARRPPSKRLQEIPNPIHENNREKHNGKDWVPRDVNNVNGRPMYSFEEYTDMILIYGKVNKNGLAAVQEYRDTFPHRRTPDRKTFEAVERGLRETGSFKPKRIGAKLVVNVAQGTIIMNKQ
ncbi:hypothetical protein J6590_090692 [Homalodisca vitripennis]|nr:hypothetical protein J6590_090692 [Homalodisca vitripennis]